MHELPGELLRQGAPTVGIGADIGQMAADECARDSQADELVPAHAHDLDILTALRVGSFESARVQGLLDGKDKPLEFSERGETGAAGGIVRKHAVRGLSREDVSKMGRPGAHEAMHARRQEC
jgi:hypothetical protein